MKQNKELTMREKIDFMKLKLEMTEEELLNLPAARFEKAYEIAERKYEVELDIKRLKANLPI